MPNLTHSISASTSSSHAESPFGRGFRDDPDLVELIDLFLSDLPAMIEGLQQAIASDDQAKLTQLATQIRSAARGYGFGPLSDAAAQVNEPSLASELLEKSSASVSELINLMNETGRIADFPGAQR